MKVDLFDSFIIYSVLIQAKLKPQELNFEPLVAFYRPFLLQQFEKNKNLFLRFVFGTLILSKTGHINFFIKRRYIIRYVRFIDSFFSQFARVCKRLCRLRSSYVESKIVNIQYTFDLKKCCPIDIIKHIKKEEKEVVEVFFREGESSESFYIPTFNFQNVQTFSSCQIKVGKAFTIRLIAQKLRGSGTCMNFQCFNRVVALLKPFLRRQQFSL